MFRGTYSTYKTNEDLNFFNLNPCGSVHLKIYKEFTIKIR
jgi:hypothetical protein